MSFCWYGASEVDKIARVRISGALCSHGHYQDSLFLCSFSLYYEALCRTIGNLQRVLLVDGALGRITNGVPTNPMAQGRLISSFRINHEV